MLDHRGMRAFNGQLKRAVGFFANRKTDRLRRRHSGVARANNFVPAADDRTLHKAKASERGPADFGHQCGHRFGFAAARTLKRLGRYRLFRALWRCWWLAFIHHLIHAILHACRPTD